MKYECKKCGGQFMVIKNPVNYDVTYCPFCRVGELKEGDSREKKI